MSNVNKKEIRHIAKLAELEFSDEKIEKFTSQIDKILNHVAKIENVDTANVKPTSHIFKIKNVFREDIPEKSISREDALKNAPREMDGGFKVPKID